MPTAPERSDGASSTTTTPAASKSSNFYLGFLFLSAEKRAALDAVYSYCRLIDDIVDEGLPKEEARRQLDFWVEEIDRLYAGAPTHPVAVALAPHVKRFDLPRDGFREMIRGCRMDLEGAHYETIADLESYMRGVAGSVGTLSVRIFGATHSRPEDLAKFARDFGYAFQLTNIIRDVGADLELGRVYLPEADMREAGYSRDRLTARLHDGAFDKLMKREYDRAKQYYKDARLALDFRDRPAMMPAEIMAHIYEGLLDEIKAHGFRVLFAKTRLTPLRKAKLAGKAWLYCHGIHL